MRRLILIALPVIIASGVYSAAAFITGPSKYGNPSADISISAGADSQTYVKQGFLCLQGEILDEAQAASWFAKAAKKGNAEAQEALGFFYATGHGVLKNEMEADKWLQKAAAQGGAVLIPSSEFEKYRNAAPGDEDVVLEEAKKKYREAYRGLVQASALTFGDMHNIFNDDVALRLYRVAADKNNAAAQL